MTNFPRGQLEAYTTSFPPWPMPMPLVGFGDDGVHFDHVEPPHPRARQLRRNNRIFIPVPNVGSWAANEWVIDVTATLFGVGGTSDLELISQDDEDVGNEIIVVATIPPIAGPPDTVTYTYSVQHDIFDDDIAGRNLGLRFVTTPPAIVVDLPDIRFFGTLSMTPIEDGFADQEFILDEWYLPHAAYSFATTSPIIPAAEAPSQLVGLQGDLLRNSITGEITLPDAGNFVLWMGGEANTVRSDRTGTNANIPIQVFVNGIQKHEEIIVRSSSDTAEFVPLFFVTGTLALDAGTVAVINGDATFDIETTGRLRLRAV